jgi:hypothetical protein
VIDTSKLDSAQVESTIGTWLKLSTSRIWQEGLYWYDGAHKIAQGLSGDYDIPLWVSCAILAVLSPGCNWSQNVDDAEAIIKAWRCGLEPEDVPTGTYNAQKYKAWRILQNYQTMTDEPTRLDAIGKDSARKTRRFYQNMIDTDAPVVTIDRWITRAVMLAQDATHPTERLYLLIEKAFVNVARALDLQPCQVQAIVWLVIRDRGLDGRAQDYLF